MATNDTTLLIKLPGDLKGAFKGLCDAKGVTVSEELRRFMADAVVDATKGMSSPTVPRTIVPKTMPNKNQSKTLDPVRCPDTVDMFTTGTPQNEPQAIKRINTEGNTRKRRKKSKRRK